MFCDEAQMAAMFGGDEMQEGIAGEDGMFVDSKWDEGVVLSLDQECGYPDVVQEALRRLGGVIIGGGAEAERLGRVQVVKLVYRSDRFETRQVEQSGAELLFEADALFQALEEAPSVDDVLRRAETLDAGGQVDGGGNGAHAGDAFLCALAQLASEFQDDVAAE